MSENATVTMQPDSDTGGVLLDLVAATDYLSTTHRLGLTTWEAFEEAIRWWVTDRVTLPGDVPDADFAVTAVGRRPRPAAYRVRAAVRLHRRRRRPRRPRARDDPHRGA